MEKRAGGQAGKQGRVSLYFVGDVGPNRRKPESLLAPVAPVLRQADILFGQLENQLSRKGVLQVDARHGMAGPLMCAHPRNVSALTSAGFDVLSFTANHGLDFGPEAFLDTIQTLRRNDIQVIGAGKDIAEARQPAILRRKGTVFGFLAYCSVVAPGRAASKDKPGLAPLRAQTFYEQIDYQPGTPPKIISVPNEEDLRAMKQDIRELKRRVDVVIVSMHWGVHFAPAVIPMYEWELGHAAIDAGADLIIGGHPHILKGIEVYKGKVIFHSVGNLAFDLDSEKMFKSAGPRIREFSRLYPNFFMLDPAYPTYPFHPESRKSMVVQCTVAGGKIERLVFLPALINRAGQPEILRRDRPEFAEIIDYVRAAGEKEGMKTKFKIEGDEVVIQKQ